MKKEKLNIIMKVTDACNLRCIYCYNAPCEYELNIMDVRLIENLLSKIVGDFKEAHFIWHGGEPLLPGLEYYEKIFRLQEQYLHNIKITNSIQTNATLITDEFASLFHHYNVGVGVSYDGNNNENTRGKTIRSLEGISILKKYEKRVPTIKVILKEDLNKIIPIYQHFNDLELDLKLNYLFNCDLQKVKNHYTVEDYVRAMKELFLYWVNDKYCRIHIQPFEYYLAMNKKLPNRECTNASCLLTFLSMDPQGNLFPCSRFYEKKYCYGNIENFKKIDDIYNTESFINIIKPTIIKRQHCMKTCELYTYCQGGCCRDILMCEMEGNNDFFSCHVFKKIFTYIEKFCINGQIRNPMLKKLI